MNLKQAKRIRASIRASGVDVRGTKYILRNEAKTRMVEAGTNIDGTIKYVPFQPTGTLAISQSSGRAVYRRLKKVQ